MDPNDVNIERLLVRKLKQGDEEAFRKIYDRYSEKVYFFAIRYYNSPEDAENIVQDIFIKIWNERQSLREELSFNSYVFTITKNYLFNVHRKKINEKAYREYLVHRMTSNDNPVENDVIYADLKNRIDKVIADLPPQRKKVFLMSTTEGLGNKEIAEQLNLSVRTVEVHKSLALKTIKKALNKILK